MRRGMERELIEQETNPPMFMSFLTGIFRRFPVLLDDYSLVQIIWRVRDVVKVLIRSLFNMQGKGIRLSSRSMS